MSVKGRIQLWGGPLDGKWITHDVTLGVYIWRGHMYMPTNKADVMIDLYRYIKKEEAT